MFVIRDLILFWEKTDGNTTTSNLSSNGIDLHVDNFRIAIYLVMIIKRNLKICIMSQFTPEQVSELNDKLKTPEEVLQWGIENIHPKLALASSFGAEDVCVIHMLSKINPEARVFSLDTGRINQETYDVMDEIRKKYNTKIEITFPDATEVIEMVQTHGMNLFYESAENRKLCCGVRKVHPLNKMLSTLDGWITGLRSDQTQNRQESKKIEIDEQHDSMFKLNPILDWSWEQTMGYIKENDIPYNKLIERNVIFFDITHCLVPTPIKNWVKLYHTVVLFINFNFFRCLPILSLITSKTSNPTIQCR